jgi:hypothetical protein
VVVGAGDLVDHHEGARLEVDVRPSQSHAFALAQPERERHGEQRPEPVVSDVRHQRAGLVEIERFDLRVLIGDRRGQPRRVAGDVAVALGHVQGVGGRGSGGPCDFPGQICGLWKRGTLGFDRPWAGPQLDSSHREDYGAQRSTGRSKLWAIDGPPTSGSQPGSVLTARAVRWAEEQGKPAPSAGVIRDHYQSHLEEQVRRGRQVHIYGHPEVPGAVAGEVLPPVVRRAKALGLPS